MFLDPQKDLLLHSIDNVQDITSDSLFNIPQLYRESYDEINHPSSLAHDWRWNISHQKSVGMAELSVSGSNNLQEALGYGKLTHRLLSISKRLKCINTVS